MEQRTNVSGFCVVLRHEKLKLLNSSNVLHTASGKVNGLCCALS